MLIFLLLFVGVFLVWHFATKRFISPWYLYIVVGKKRSGKSTLATKLAYKYLKKGYHVYTNMEDCLIPSVRIINPADLSVYKPEEKSVLLLDEAGSLYDNREFKKFKSGERDFYIYQGHYKCVVYLFSQANNVDAKLRQLADGLYIVVKLLRVLSIAKRVNRTIKLTEASSEQDSRIADQLVYAPFWEWKFTYIPYWKNKFNSFVIPPALQRDYLPYVEVKEVCDDDTVSL